MKRSVRARVGRADLAWALARVPEERTSTAASLLGFDAPEERPTCAAIAPAAGRTDREIRTTEDSEGVATTAVGFPPLWRLERMTFTDADKEDRRTKEKAPSQKPQLSPEDLAGQGGSLWGTPRTRPLRPWSQLWPLLHGVLQTSADSREPDIPAVIRAWGRGEFLGTIPRLPRAVWAHRAALWIDESPRLAPFWDDQQAVTEGLRAVGGAANYPVRRLDPFDQHEMRTSTGHFADRSRCDADVPILLLGDLGLYGTDTERAAWLRTAEHLRKRGTPVCALVPAPTGRWDAAVARAWNALAWERDRRSISAAREESAGSAEASPSPKPRDLNEAHWQKRAERLLRALAPAALAQPGLVRALRLALPATEVDVAAEVDVCRHPDVRAADASGLVLHPEAAVRWKKAFADEEPIEIQERVTAILEQWHRGMPAELRHTETLSWLSMMDGRRASAPGDVEQALAFADRLEGSAEAHRGRQSREGAVLRRFARKMLPALPDAVYREVPSLKTVWKVANEDLEDARVPEFVDPPAEGRPEWWAVRQVAHSLVFSRSPNGAWPSEDRGPGSPVAWLFAAGPRLFVRQGEAGSERQWLLRPGLTLPLREGQGVELRTALCAVKIGCWRQEPWAVAAGQDRFGLWADAEVKRGEESARLRFRWIPPGRFRMGSPETEEGRSDREGPQHQVTWTEGRWLCDAPVTQALWQVVMGSNPSRFKSPDRPVERVSWNECMKFTERLNALAPGIEVRLPSEAEWEHACRAGTETATWVGDLKILGDNNAPLLDAIAWYGGNCGRDFELGNGADIRWPETQYDDERGGSHPVKKKLPNPLGLYDMLGNVYEWCVDGNGLDASYATQPYGAEDVSDPLPPTLGSGRVARGGSWLGNARYVRAADRGALTPDDRDSYLGFRLARGQSGKARSAQGEADAERRPREGRGAAAEPGRGTRPGSGAAEGRGGASAVSELVRSLRKDKA